MRDRLDKPSDAQCLDGEPSDGETARPRAPYLTLFLALRNSRGRTRHTDEGNRAQAYSSFMPRRAATQVANCTRNVVPCCGFDSNPMLAPIRSAASSAIAKPNPLPFLSAPAPRQKRSNTCL